MSRASRGATVPVQLRPRQAAAAWRRRGAARSRAARRCGLHVGGTRRYTPSCAATHGRRPAAPVPGREREREREREMKRKRERERCRVGDR
eukprot:scaffold5713_cov35-Phaeocystis_antarctica.AAC.1